MSATSRNALKNTFCNMTKEGHLSADALERSLAIIGVRPNKEDWRAFINTTLMSLGITLLLAGIVFFFAYNWADLPRLGKLATVQTLVLIGVLIAGLKGLDNLVGKIALMAASVLVGVALATYGQIYQTGADAYELFVGWSLLIAGWVIVSRFAALWCFWLMLINLSFVLWIEQVYGYRAWNKQSVHLILFGVNILPLALWEYFSWRGIDWMKVRWLPRLMHLGLHAVLLPPTLMTIIHSRHTFFLSCLLYIVCILGTFLTYRNRVRDLFALMINCISVIIVATTIVIKMIDNIEFGHFLFLSVFVLGLGGAAAHWLNGVNKSWKNN